MTSPMPKVTLPAEEWQYISVLIARDVNGDRMNGIDILADYHEEIWHKIQLACQWNEEGNSDD